MSRDIAQPACRPYGAGDGDCPCSISILGLTPQATRCRPFRARSTSLPESLRSASPPRAGWSVSRLAAHQRIRWDRNRPRAAPPPEVGRQPDIFGGEHTRRTLFQAHHRSSKESWHPSQVPGSPSLRLAGHGTANMPPGSPESAGPRPTIARRKPRICRPSPTPRAPPGR